MQAIATSSVASYLAAFSPSGLPCFFQVGLDYNTVPLDYGYIVSLPLHGQADVNKASDDLKTLSDFLVFTLGPPCGTTLYIHGSSQGDWSIGCDNHPELCCAPPPPDRPDAPPPLPLPPQPPPLPQTPDLPIVPPVPPAMPGFPDVPPDHPLSPSPPPSEPTFNLDIAITRWGGSCEALQNIYFTVSHEDMCDVSDVYI